MLKATLRIDGDDADITVPTISPDLERELPRTESKISYGNGCAEIEITATDTTAMRAAINSYLECIRIIENIGNITRVRP